jgi:hypothetical protein
MGRRVWESRSFANVVALMALFVALGGTAVGQEGSSVRDAQAPAFNAIVKQLQERNGWVTSGMIRTNAVRAPDIRKNSVTGPDIRNGTVRAPDIRRETITEELIQKDTITSETIKEDELRGVEKCSNDLLGPFGDVCATAAQPATDWSQAELACDHMGMRLPTITEGLRVLSSSPELQAIWTDEVWGSDGDNPGRFGALRRTSPAPDEIYLEGHAHSDSIAFRCVIKSSSST